MSFEDNNQAVPVDEPVALETNDVSPTVMVWAKGINAVPGEGAQVDWATLKSIFDSVESLNSVAVKADWKASAVRFFTDFAEVHFAKAKQGGLFQPKVSAPNLSEWIVAKLQSSADHVNRRAVGESIGSPVKDEMTNERSFDLDPPTDETTEKALKKLVDAGVAVSASINAKAMGMPARKDFGNQSLKVVEPVQTKIKIVATTPDRRQGFDNFANLIDLASFAGVRSIQAGDELEGLFIMGSPTTTRKIIPVTDSKFVQTSITGELNVIQPKQLQLLGD